MKLSTSIIPRLTLIAAACLVAPQASFAASAMAEAKFLGASVREATGTASFTVTSVSVLEAFASTTNGAADPTNDGMTFQSFYSAFGEGTALNSGYSGASSLATASEFTTSHALTWADVDVQLAGAGSVTVDFEYSLSVDAFDNLPSSFAIAGIEVSASFSPLQTMLLDLDGSEVTGFGSNESLVGMLTLIFEFDDLGLGPIDDTVVLHTFASAQAAPVPVPAAVWLFGSAVLSVAAARRRVAA